MADKLRAHGNAVHSFAATMQNLGLAHQVDQLMGLFRSGYWREFRDGLGTYRFLPGEFDYFLTQWGVDRATVLTFPIDARVELLAAMDERRTGEEGYRRRLEDARKENPGRPDPINGFGYTEREAKVQEGPASTTRVGHRPALGDRVRRVAEGRPIPKANEASRLERVRRRVLRLPDDELEAIYQAVAAERQERKRRA